MSSGTIVDLYAARQLSGAAGDKILEGIERLGLSPRQQDLNRLWAWYRCQNYATRGADWDGSKHVDPLDHEVIAQSATIPPGFYDAGNSILPLKFRRPTAPYAMAKVVVDRFTGLLFSEKRHPHVRAEGDPDTEDFVQALAEEGRLWAAMIQARTFGGAMGTVAMGFSVVDGRPTFEVHDARWCVPEFKDRTTLKLRSIEKKYQYPVEQQDRISGKWKEVPYWYRRVIDEQSDTLYEPVPVPEDGSEPKWVVQEQAAHGLGFCPVVWIQNLPVQDSIDGDPDCHGIYDMIEAIDALVAQANRSIVANCDPTVVIASSAKMSEVAKGSDNAIKLPQGSTAQYLEIAGTGPTSALELAEKLRNYALEVAQCVLDHPDTANRTATEIERIYSSMLSKADVMREQYGQKGVLPLLDMAVKVARKVSRPQSVEGGVVVRTISLSPRLVPSEDGERPPQTAPRKLGEGGFLKLQWGAYFTASLTDVTAAVTAAAKAKDAGLVDREHATQFVADEFSVDDVGQMLARIKAEKEEEQRRIEESLMAGVGAAGGVLAKTEVAG